LVRHLAAAKAQRHFDLVAILQKLEHIAHLHIVIVVVRVGTELHLFDLDGLLLFTRLSFFLLSLVFEFPVIHDFAYGRIGVWRNLNKVQPGILCHGHCALRCHNTDIFAFRADKAYFVGPNSVVHSGAGVALWRRVMGSACYDLCPFAVIAVRAKVRPHASGFNPQKCADASPFPPYSGFPLFLA